MLLQFCILGLGAGAAYTLLAQGAILVYRGSGLVNFAQGAVSMAAAYLCYEEFEMKQGWGFTLSFIAAVVSAAAIGLTFQQLVLRQMRRSSPLTRVISTLGLLIILQGVVEKRYGDSTNVVPPFLPQTTFHWGSVVVQEDRLILTGIAVAVTVLLWAVMRFTRIGLAITASSENERAVSTLGWSPNVLGAVTWSAGCALAGVAGVLVSPITGLSPGVFTLLVTVSGLAAALVGGFTSFPLTLLGGMVLGIGESVVTLYQPNIQSFFGLQLMTGTSQLVPLVVIIVVLVVRGRGLPLRSHVVERLPKLGSGQIRWPEIAVGVALTAVLVTMVFNQTWVSAVSLSISIGIILLSVIMLTGYAGQLSLGQYAIGGLGALFSAKLLANVGFPAPLAIIGGMILAIPASLVLALPALRTRGVNLAVVTLSLGFTIESIIFNNPAITGKILADGTPIGRVRMFGMDVSSVAHPARWAIVCLICFVLPALALANLRRSATGRRLLAMRTNERAAAALGVSVFRAKIYAFAVAGAIAALGGTLLGFRYSVVQYGGFDAFQSIYAVAYSVIGGVGYVVGSIIGSFLPVGGVGNQAFQSFFSLGSWTTLVGGVLLLLAVIAQPNGAALPVAELWQKIRSKLVYRGPRAFNLPEAKPERVTPTTLRIEDLTVKFGNVIAVNNVSLEVEPGQIVGLIGPNGAGKTTLIDAVTGLVGASNGRINIDGEDITSWAASRRARHGLRRSFQSLELFEDLTVLENIMAGADEVTRYSWLTDLLWPKNRPLTPSAVAAVNEFHLTDRLEELPPSLSYGERRLLAIARAVASGPPLLLLDEPAAGLDETQSRELGSLIRRLANERGMGILLVEHDVGLVMSTCDRVVVIDFGESIADGCPDEVRIDERVITAYLGERELQGTGPP
jgi:ABC-type branched-subunit amino acid transport system ATPase component/branched-subunit amino acid ABC-type transport system permease component